MHNFRKLDIQQILLKALQKQVIEILHDSLKCQLVHCLNWKRN